MLNVRYRIDKSCGKCMEQWSVMKLVSEPIYVSLKNFLPQRIANRFFDKISLNNHYSCHQLSEWQVNKYIINLLGRIT